MSDISTVGLDLAKATLKGVETFRAIGRGDFHACKTGVLNEFHFVRNLFEDGRKAT